MIDKITELPMFLANNSIGGLFISVALIIFIKFLLKEKIETKITLEIISCVVIIYSTISLISWLLVFVFPNYKNYVFLNIKTVLFTRVYWLFFLINSLVPLILLNKKVRKNIYIIFLLSLFMNLGWVFEWFLKLKTTNYMYYFEGNYTDFYFSGRQTPTLIKGFIVGLVFLIIGNVIKKSKPIV